MPVIELGHVHYLMGILLWVNVLANVPFHLLIDTDQFFAFDTIFDSFQLCSAMLVHLLFNRILSFKVEDHRKFYLALGLYCYLVNFVMLVTKDVLRHVLSTLQPDGT